MLRLSSRQWWCCWCCGCMLLSVAIGTRDAPRTHALVMTALAANTGSGLPVQPVAARPFDMGCSATWRPVAHLQVMVIAPAWCQVDWAWAGRGPLISLQAPSSKQRLVPGTLEEWGRSLWLRGFRAVSSAPVWLGWLRGRVNRRRSSRRRRPKSRCVALRCAATCCAVPCSAVPGVLARCFLRRGHGSRVSTDKEEEEGEDVGLASAGPLTPCLPCPSLPLPFLPL